MRGRGSGGWGSVIIGEIRHRDAGKYPEKIIFGFPALYLAFPAYPQKVLHQGPGGFFAVPDQQNLCFQRRLRNWTDGKGAAEVFHGFWEYGGSQSLLCPLHGIPGVVADAQNVRLQILGVKGIQNKALIPAVQDQGNLCQRREPNISTLPAAGT